MLPEDYILIRQLLVTCKSAEEFIEQLIKELYRRKKLTRTQYDELIKIYDALFK